MRNNTSSTFRMLALLTLGVLSLTFSSCQDDQDDNEQIKVDGIYIVNEGQFGNNNGSITLMDPETGDVIHNYFADNNNGRSPGDVVQDLSFSRDMAYIVSNNSKTLAVIDKESFEQKDEVPAINYPRQFMVVNQDKGYLTNGSSADSSRGHILIIDLNDHSIADSIEVGRGPESMVKADNKVFVTNSGGWKIDNTVTVIDISSDEVIQTVEVGDIPTDMVVDKNNNVWVFCKGLSQWSSGGPTDSKLMKINADNFNTSMINTGKTSTGGYYPLAIGPNREMLYFVGKSGIYKMNISDSEAPNEPIIDRIAYGLDVNPENGTIYCLTTDFQTKGFVYRYDQEYSLKDSIQVGYNPNAVVFK